MFASVSIEVWTARDPIQSSSVCCDFAFMPCFRLLVVADFVNASQQIEISSLQMGFPVETRVIIAVIVVVVSQ